MTTRLFPSAREDHAFADYLAEESAARAHHELGALCAGCGEHCGHDPFVAAPGEEYCDGCALELAAHIARGAIPHGGTANDPDSLTVLGVRS